VLPAEGTKGSSEGFDPICDTGPSNIGLVNHCKLAIGLVIDQTKGVGPGFSRHGADGRAVDSGEQLRPKVLRVSSGSHFFIYLGDDKILFT
jgi:hypothetical protein